MVKMVLSQAHVMAELVHHRDADLLDQVVEVLGQ